MSGRAGASEVPGADGSAESNACDPVTEQTPDDEAAFQEWLQSDEGRRALSHPVVEIPVEEVSGTARRWGGIHSGWLLMDPLPSPLPQWRRENPAPRCSDCGIGDAPETIVRPTSCRDARLRCASCCANRRGRTRA